MLQIGSEFMYLTHLSASSKLAELKWNKHRSPFISISYSSDRLYVRTMTDKYVYVVVFFLRRPRQTPCMILKIAKLGRGSQNLSFLFAYIDCRNEWFLIIKFAVGMDGVKCILNDILGNALLFRAIHSYKKQITSVNTVTSIIIMDGSAQDG